MKEILLIEKKKKKQFFIIVFYYIISWAIISDIVTKNSNREINLVELLGRNILTVKLFYIYFLYNIYLMEILIHCWEVLFFQSALFQYLVFEISQKLFQ